MNAHNRRFFAYFTTGSILFALALLSMLQQPVSQIDMDTPTYRFQRDSTDRETRRKFAIPATQKLPVRIFRDTVSTNSFELKNRKKINGGSYFKETNSARIVHYRDTLPESEYPDGMRKISDLNEIFEFCDYHEVRHGLNNYFIGRTPDQNIKLHIANEFWARAAEGLARYCNMPRIKTRTVDLDVNYKLFAARRPQITELTYLTARPNNPGQYVRIGTELRTAADSALTFATNRFSRTFGAYTDYLNGLKYDIYAVSCDQNPDNLIDWNAALDSMRIFTIDGKRIDLFAIASDSVRIRAEKFMNETAPARLRAAAEKSR